MADAWWQLYLNVLLDDCLYLILLNFATQAEPQDLLVLNVVIALGVLLEDSGVGSDNLEAMVLLWLIFDNIISCTDFTQIVQREAFFFAISRVLLHQ